MILRRSVSRWPCRDLARPTCRPRLEVLEDRWVPAFITDAYVSSLYQGLLGRPLDAAGQAFWAAPLDVGAPRTFPAQGIVASGEYNVRQVQDLYQRLLFRNADPDGQSLFVSTLETGTLNDARAIMLGTDEFFARNGGTTDGFLSALFQQVLQRSPTPTELTQTAALDNEFARRDVATELLESPEANVVTVSDFYRATLGREPDAFGLDFWTSLLDAGATEESVLSGFLGSDEYFTLLETSLAQAGGSDVDQAAQAFLTRINQQGGSLIGAPSPSLDPFSNSSVVATFQLTTAGLPFGPLPFNDQTGTTLGDTTFTTDLGTDAGLSSPPTVFGVPPFETVI
jgi:hypothetical protein